MTSIMSVVSLFMAFAVYLLSLAIMGPEAGVNRGGVH